LAFVATSVNEWTFGAAGQATDNPLDHTLTFIRLWRTRGHGTSNAMFATTERSLQLSRALVSCRNVRLTKIVLTVLGAIAAVVAGLLTAAVIALGATLAVVAQRLLRGSRMPARSGDRRSGRPRPTDVIDVSATEVPADTPGLKH
jgi:hypothetical protein